MPKDILSPPDLLSAEDVLQALEMNCVDHEETDRFFVVPGKHGPRWLIPAQSRASVTVLGSWRPYSLSSRIKWGVIKMAARAEALHLVRNVSCVSASRGGTLQWLQRCGISSQDSGMVILVGNPSPDRKLIVFLLDGAHRIAAVLKIGLTVGAGLSILREAEVLAKLQNYQWVAKILSIESNRRAAAQKFVEGKMPNRGFQPAYMDLLCNFPTSGAFKSFADVAEDLANRLSPFKSKLDDLAPGLLDRCHACLDRKIDVPTMLVHGDFSPWNLRDNPETGLVLVDWEWASFDGLPAQDLLHFQFSDDRLFGEKAGGYAAIREKSISAEYFRRMNLDLELLPYLALAYMLDQLDAHCNNRGPQYIPYALRQLGIIVASLDSKA
jgi:Phosphotransferase enzyme family